MRAVPESRLHGKAAEANFGRASSGNSVTALRHAALISELIGDLEPPGADLLRRSSTPTGPEPSKLPLLRVPIQAAERPPLPESPPPTPQFLVAGGECPQLGWADPSPEDLHSDLQTPMSGSQTPISRSRTPLSSRFVRESAADSRPASKQSKRELSPILRADDNAWAKSCSTPKNDREGQPNSVASVRSPSVDVAAARSLRLESLVTSRAAAAERCAASARSWREGHEQVVSNEDTGGFSGQHKQMLKRGFQALMEFLQFTNRGSGNPVRTWFIMDPEANMKMGARQFERKCMEMGFRGNIPALWKYIDRKGDGVVSLLELHPQSANELARFKLLIKQRFKDSAENAFRFLDVNRSGRLNRVLFQARLQGIKYNGKAAKLFEYLDRDGLGHLTVHSFSFFDTWRLPLYTYHEPDQRKFNAVKDKLLEVYQHPLRAWRKIEKEGSLTLAFETFRGVCHDLLLNGVQGVTGLPANFPRTDADVAGAWRCLDQDGVGYARLRHWDMRSHETLVEFKEWADRVHGSVVAAFHNLDVGGAAGSSNAKLSENELKACTRGPDPCKADMEFLFDGLDVGGNWSLTEPDVRFLDYWDVEWEEWEEQAASKNRALNAVVAWQKQSSFPEPQVSLNPKLTKA
eukprot:TRINITY_DN24084_c0_g1_i1.p1 TRINITY_DN24084_c0_g1~~TRINITY_DN24084_c0_g1_i1.p1  ORF type:complete len:633 (-),score=110.18 TRINITY_DN24084_c0_g1_i1:68-1966(-)